MRKALSTILVTPLLSASALYLNLTASPVLAEEVLYCVDTQAVGFVWDNGNVRRRAFTQERIICAESTSFEPWAFYRNTYTRAFLAGPPAGGTDPNTWIAYGTCTKF